ncbi:MAG TPA: hypothetical protein VE959_24080 [Bryobacteraceae bacterium]|nr:hypothetical protein [Bryobacteraceae bacterium]
MTTPDILILSGDGMLGHKIFQRLRASAATIRSRHPPPRVDLLAGAGVIPGIDLMHLDRTAELLADLRPKFVINCAGIVKQRAESSDAIPNFTINSPQPQRRIDQAGGPYAAGASSDPGRCQTQRHGQADHGPDQPGSRRRPSAPQGRLRVVTGTNVLI